MITIGASCFLLLSYLLIGSLITYYSGEFTYAKAQDVAEKVVPVPRHRSAKKVVVYYHYHYKNQLYIGSCDADNSKNSYGIGDSVLIKFLPSNPQNAIVVENYWFKNTLLIVGWVVSFMIAFGLYKWG